MEQHSAKNTDPASHGAKGPRGKLPFLILGGLGVFTLLVLGVYALWTAGEESTDDAQVESDVVPIAARIGGAIREVRVSDNQTVHRGDLVLLIDDADYGARVDQAEAELETARAQAAIAVAGLDRAGADVRKAALDLSRARQLHAENAIPEERFDSAQIAYQAAQAALAQARAQAAAAGAVAPGVDLMVDGTGVAHDPAGAGRPPTEAGVRVELASARVKSAEAALALARLQFSYTRVTAPADGTISKLSVHEGQLLQTGQPVAELVPSDTYVVANFKETQVGRMKPGQRAVVSIDAYPGRSIEGRVESLSGGTGARFSLLPPDNASGNFVKVVQRVPVRIAWSRSPAGLDLRAGLSADVTVYTKGR